MPLPVLAPLPATSAFGRRLTGEWLLESGFDGGAHLVHVDGTVASRTRAARGVTAVLPEREKASRIR